MAISAGLQQLIAEIYEAAFDPQLWERVFASLCRATSSAGVVITTSNIDFDNISRPHLYNIAPAAWDIYTANMLAVCPRFRYIRQAKPEDVFYDHCHSSPEVIKASEYYNALEQHWGTRYYMAKLLPISDHAVAHFSLHRKASENHYQTSEIRILETLAPHIIRALQMNNKLVLRDCLQSFAGGDRLESDSAIILDSNSVPIHVTDEANKIVTGYDALKMESGALTTRYHSDQAKLNDLISGAVRATIANKKSPGNIMALRKRSGRRPYKVQVSPVSRRNRFCPLLDAVAAVLITDPEQFSLPDMNYLSQLYNLTPTESRFASTFIQCGSLRECTGHLGISKNTARAHLQNIFRKTATASQAELLKLMISS